jgi:LPS O-antigen subunit length determinant protein (WzzB/FepE family)
MKKFRDLPVYFIIVGLVINIIMYFYHEVTFIELMIRSSIIVLLFAAIGYLLAYVLNDAHSALAINKKAKETQKKAEENNAGSTIDIRVNQDDDEELLKMTSLEDKEEFVELDVKAFERFLNKD